MRIPTFTHQLAAGLLILSGFVGSAHAALADRLSEFMLPNGLKLIVIEDHRAPVVTSQIWYKVGSSYETSGITGVSHVLEHMMFKGTEKVPTGEFSRIISANGGRENAFTGRDYTAYFQTLHIDRLETAFKLESDRLRGALIPEKEFIKELEVVKEERRLRTEDKPRSKAYEQFLADAYTTSPYRNPIIGWMADLDHLTAADLRTWYDNWYQPNNATLIVAGDVDPQHVKALADKYYASIPSGEVAISKPRPEVKQLGERRATIRLKAKLPYLMMGYKTPILGTADEDWEPYALSLLAEVLDGSDSSRLTRELIRGKAIAASAGADYSALARLPGMFTLSGTPAPGVTVDELEVALRTQVKQLQTELVEQQELDRVISRAIASEVYEQDSIFYQAMRTGIAETIGIGWPVLDKSIERMRSVTPEQIRAVAKKYLIDETLSVGILDPLPLDAASAKTGPSHSGGKHGA